jgi:hypothetical protein
MPRQISTQLASLLSKPVIWTQTTLDLFPPNDSPIYLSTSQFTAAGKNYLPHLIAADEIKQTIGVGTNLVNVRIQNVDKQFGEMAVADELSNVPAVIGRAFQDIAGGTILWEPLFTGVANAVEFDEGSVRIEVVSDLTAAGYVVSAWSLSDHCQFVFKQSDTCGYSGSETSCNLRRLSLGGCLGRANEHRFGGMEFPDPQVPDPPTGGQDFPGGGGGGLPSCPREDQWVLVMEGERIATRRAGAVQRGDLLVDPRTDRVNRVEEVSIHECEIWAAETYRRGLIFASGSHPLIGGMTDKKGRAISALERGNRVMVFTGTGLWIEPLRQVRNTGKFGRVVKLTLSPGHIYAAGHDAGAMILAHNSKPVGGPEV